MFSETCHLSLVTYPSLFRAKKKRKNPSNKDEFSFSKREENKEERREKREERREKGEGGVVRCEFGNQVEEEKLDMEMSLYLSSYLHKV